MCEQDLALNDLEGLICHKNQPTNQPTTKDSIVDHILLQHLLSAYHTLLAAVGEGIPIENLVEIADNIVDLTSDHTALIPGVRTSE